MTPNPSTAIRVLDLAKPFGPAVEGQELVFDREPPPDLLAALNVLHTGVRALLAGRKWFGCNTNTGRVVELAPALPIPAVVSLLAVEGDSQWDRVRSATRLELPQLFARAG
jgi:hypothetical protein